MEPGTKPVDAAQSTRYSLLLRIADPQNHTAWVEFLAIYEPLVYQLARRRGLQDADAQVRRAAADALSGFGTDPRVRQWLEFVAQSDADTRVRREAQQALRELQRPGAAGR